MKRYRCLRHMRLRMISNPPPALAKLMLLPYGKPEKDINMTINQGKCTDCGQPSKWMECQACEGEGFELDAEECWMCEALGEWRSCGCDD